LSFPPFKSQRRGEAQSRGEREIRNELSFQASQGLGKKKKASDEPESLASRICRTLDGVPRSGKCGGGRSKCDRASFRISFNSKKKWPLFGRATKNKKHNFSLSARVLQRKPTRQPAQKKAVILYATKQVQYDPESQYI